MAQRHYGKTIEFPNGRKTEGVTPYGTGLASGIVQTTRPNDTTAYAAGDVVGGVEVYQTTDTHLQGAAMCGISCSNAPNVRFGWSGFKPIY